MITLKFRKQLNKLNKNLISSLQTKARLLFSTVEKRLKYKFVFIYFTIKQKQKFQYIYM